MFAVAAVVAFAVALILQWAGVSKGTFLTVPSFALIGLLCIAAHLAFAVPLPWRRAAQP